MGPGGPVSFGLAVRQESAGCHNSRRMATPGDLILSPSPRPSLLEPGAREPFGAATDGGNEAFPPSGEAADRGTEAFPPSGEAADGGNEAFPPSGETVDGGTEAFPPSGETVDGGNEAFPPSGEAVDGGNEAFPPSGETVDGGTEAFPPSGEAVDGGNEAFPPSGEAVDGGNEAFPPSGEAADRGNEAFPPCLFFGSGSLAAPGASAEGLDAVRSQLLVAAAELDRQSVAEKRELDASLLQDLLKLARGGLLGGVKGSAFGHELARTLVHRLELRPSCR